MRVIFLDVDGVLISEERFWRAQLAPGAPLLYSPAALTALRSLAERSGARVVLTSSWRPAPGCAPAPLWLQLQSVLAHNGTPAAGATPFLADGRRDRGEEIAAWLADHPAEGFVILDDHDRFSSQPALRHRLVRMNPRTGLTAQDAEKALPLLLSPPPPA